MAVSSRVAWGWQCRNCGHDQEAPAWRLLDARERGDVIARPGAGVSWVACAQCQERREIDAPLLVIRPGAPISLLLAVHPRELGGPPLDPPSGHILVEEANAALGRGTAGISGPTIPLPRPLLDLVLRRDTTADAADPDGAVDEVARTESERIVSWYRSFLEIVRGSEGNRSLLRALEQVWRVPWPELASFLEQHPEVYAPAGVARVRAEVDRFLQAESRDPGHEQIRSALRARLTLLADLADGRTVADSVADYLAVMGNAGGALDARLGNLLAETAAHTGTGGIPQLREAIDLADGMGREDIAAGVSGSLGSKLLQLPITDDALTEEAISALERALAGISAEDPRWVPIAGDLANAYQRRVRGDAIENWARARALIEQVCDSVDRQSDPETWALYQSNFGFFLGERPGGSSPEDIREGISHMHAALEERSPERGVVDWAYSQLNLGVLHQRRNAAGDLAAAAGCYRDALARLRPDDDLRLWAALQHDLADALLSGDPPDLDGATAAVQAALGAVSRARDPLTAGRLTAMLARVAERRSGPLAAEVLRLREDALSLIPPALAPASYLAIGGLLTDAYCGVQDWPKAQSLFGSMLSAFDSLYEAQTSPQGARAVLADGPRLSRWAAYVFAKTGQPERAIEVMERGRARQLSVSVNRDTAETDRLAAADPQLAAQYSAALARYRAALEQGSPGLPEPGAGIHVTAAEQDVRDVLAAIREIPGFERFLTPMSVADICAAGGGDPVVYLLSAPAGSYVLSVRPGSSGEAIITSAEVTEVTSRNVALVLFDPDGAPGILSAQFIEAGRDELPRALDRLTLLEPLMRPVAEILASSERRRAVVVPTGLLGFVPLHAVPVDGEILDDIGEIRLAPSAAAYAACRARARRHVPAHLVGLANATGTPPALPGAESELAAIGDLFEPGAVVSLATGAAATRDWLLANAPGASHLHLGCHGANALTWPAGGVLFLAGDEVLVTDDLVDRRLSSCRLAVASACQSGHYESAGAPDEFSGLPAGFLQAGAACAVASLWQVGDRITGLLMTRFYELLDPSVPAHEQHPATALRQARTWLRGLTAEEARAFRAGHLRLSSGPSGSDRARSATARDGRRAAPYSSPQYWAAFVAWGC